MRRVIFRFGATQKVLTCERRPKVDGALETVDRFSEFVLILIEYPSAINRNGAGHVERDVIIHFEAKKDGKEEEKIRPSGANATRNIIDHDNGKSPFLFSHYYSIHFIHFD